jgi:hypothetical protein
MRYNCSMSLRRCLEDAPVARLAKGQVGKLIELHHAPAMAA